MTVSGVDRAYSWRSALPPALACIVGGLVASATAGVIMALLRWMLQVRTVPERVMEWALLFVPPAMFEAALLQLGYDAKRYALYGAIAGMLLLLAALGAITLRRRWSTGAILALGLALWLFVMVVIMPLTEAGIFATALVDGTRAAIGGYLSVALTYAATLVLARAVIERNGSARVRRAPGSLPAPGSRVAGAPSRRAALVLTGSVAASLVGTFVASYLGPRRGATTRVVVLDPQEPVPSGGIDPPKPHPNLVTTPPPPVASAPPAVDMPSAMPSPELPAAAAAREQATGPRNEPQASAPAPTPTEFPEPGPGPQLTRDADGAVLPSGRRPGELAKLVTDTDDFYIVTKNAGGDPVLRAANWRLRIDGDVQRVVELDYASLRKLPAVDVTKTLECISNFVDKCELAPFGCELISTARWTGARLSDVLNLAGGLRPGVVSLSTISADEFTTALPIEVAMAPDTVLVYAMNDQVLPREHGYPARMLVPGRYGMKSAKWVVALRPLRREFVDWYGQRQWSKEGIIRTMTRIDIPARGAELPPDEHRIAGIAYAGDRGISKVEFSTDGGTRWQVAELIEPAPGMDAWVRWQGRFVLEPGADMTLVSRATDGTGVLQPEEFSLPQPDGSSGWHHVQVRASTI